MMPRPPSAISGRVMASSPENHAGHLGDVAGSFLHPHDVGDGCQARERRWLHIHAGAPLHAIHDDGQADGRGDRLIVLVEAFLGGLVVVGRDGEDAAHAQVFEFARQFDDFARVVAARAAQHRHAALGLIDRDLDNAQVFGAREGGAFAGGAAGDQEVDARIYLAAHQTPQGCFVERLVWVERSD
jgi:hypothetical protein